MRSRKRYLNSGLALTIVPVSVLSAVMSAPPATADCTSAGAATVCAPGDVRGGGPTAPVAGPVYPSYCADPWYCDDGWDMDVIINPGPPGIGRPGRPGGGGIGPR